MAKRVTMGTKSFLKAALQEGVVAELQSQSGSPVGRFGRFSQLTDEAETDVVARILPSQDACELEGRTLLGQLFLSLLSCGAVL